MRFADRVYFETPSTGPGSPLTIGSAVAGYRTPGGALIADGETIPYIIEDGAAWEKCTGVVTGSSLTRVTEESSDGIATPLALSGAAKVFIDAPASFFNSAEDYGLITSSPTSTDDYGSIA